jgi:class 3 adenylate cyclase
MREPPLILAVDDLPDNLEILRLRLESRGYQVATAADGLEALQRMRELEPDLVLLDVSMPRLGGIEVVRTMRADPALSATPVILVTAKSDTRDVVEGLDAGGDDYLTKPFEHAALLARVRSMLRIKRLHDQVRSQANELAAWNSALERRVAEQLTEIERIGKLKRFLSPQVAELVISLGEERALESHRRDITVLFCDLRGFTAFAESAEPEEIMRVLGEYHSCLGRLIHKFEGTLDRFAGDGVMVLFNDPLPCADPQLRAMRMALEMRDGVAALALNWRKLGHDLGFGIGIAYGFATLGRVGFEGRMDYSAIGSVVNLAARLCAEAKDGQILVDGKVHAAVEDFAEVDAIGDLNLKGFHRPVRAFNVNSVRV